MRLILASGSPRRADLLRSAGYEFEQLSVEVDERVLPAESPSEYVLRVAAEKSARARSLLQHDAVVLSADTAVVVSGCILGKPENGTEAGEMLRRLSGRAHEVLTGVSIRTVDAHWSAVESTAVWFSELSPRDVAWYVGTGEGRDKAGGYAIQGLGSRFIPRIEGSYSNVVGLPIATVHALLRRCQADG